MSVALIVFARAPVPGAAKTRLIPALGADGAAALAHRLLRHTLRAALACPASQHLLCVTPDTAHPAFQEAVRDAAGRLRLTAQGAGDLGARMNRALTQALRTQPRALLLGTDAPALSSAVLKEADAALLRHDAVFVPAHDGGYALVGLARPAPELFTNMVWSTDTVLHATRQRARAHGLRWAELDPVHDIDEPADLIHLPAGWQT